MINSDPEIVQQIDCVYVNISSIKFDTKLHSIIEYFPLYTNHLALNVTNLYVIPKIDL